MTGASKILTVSYGTFSCTLEGFDEPFNTMKAIAEYFRDLAAEDRYFGAEPPTPDPAMLHQIAKREIQRRVDAKIDENGVVLRAGFADEPSAPAAVTPRLTESAPAAESAAAKLSRIRAAAQPAPAVASAVSDFSEDEHATSVSEAQTAPAFDEFDIDAFNDALLIDDIDQIADNLPEALPEAVALVDLAATDADLPEAGLGDSADQDVTDLAALEAPKALDAQLEDDLIAEIDQSDESDEIAEDEALLASLGALIQPVAVDGDAAAPEATDLADETDLARFVDDEGDSDMVDPAPVPAAIEAPASIRTEKLDRARARVIRIRRAEAGPAGEPVEPEAAGDAGAVAQQSVLSDELEAALQAELAALEAETPAQTAPVSQDKVAPVLVQPHAAESAADARKLLEAEAGDDAVSRLIAHTNSEMEGPETRRRQSAIAHLKAAVAATVAERQLNGPNAGQSGETRSEAYRSDLDRVVRQRQPGEAGADRPSPLVLVSEQRIDRPRSGTSPTASAPQIVRPRRVSPVQLATQHIQLQADPAPKAALPLEEPVNALAVSAPKSFAEYAEDRGAAGLESLLEAAALYRAEVLHQVQFSRADLFEAVTSLPATADVSLEDTLRSFGTLLRDGRIAKVRRGQFRLTAVPAQTLATDRAAG